MRTGISAGKSTTIQFSYLGCDWIVARVSACESPASVPQSNYCGALYIRVRYHETESLLVLTRGNKEADHLTLPGHRGSARR